MMQSWGRAHASRPIEVEPELVLRAAKPADVGALAKLLSQLSCVSASKAEVARNLAALSKGGADIHVAELGRLVGCIAWAVVPTLQRGPLGRITVVVVDEEHRQRQIGTRLLAEAEAALAKKGLRSSGGVERYRNQEFPQFLPYLEIRPDELSLRA